jgi:hypothetical protein
MYWIFNIDARRLSVLLISSKNVLQKRLATVFIHNNSNRANNILFFLTKTKLSFLMYLHARTARLTTCLQNKILNAHQKSA